MGKLPYVAYEFIHFCRWEYQNGLVFAVRYCFQIAPKRSPSARVIISDTPLGSLYPQEIIICSHVHYRMFKTFSWLQVVLKLLRIVSWIIANLLSLDGLKSFSKPPWFFPDRCKFLPKRLFNAIPINLVHIIFRLTSFTKMLNWPLS